MEHDQVRQRHLLSQTVTELPFNRTLLSRFDSGLYFSTFNWVLGNTNPMDFAPPFFCAKSKLEVTETPDNMFTALKALALKTQRGD